MPPTAAGLYFVLNLILAVSYSAFQDLTKTKMLETVTKRVECLDTAYHLIVSSPHFGTPDSELDIHTWRELMQILRPDLTMLQVQVRRHRESPGRFSILRLARKE